jgi:ABC-type multidrug transport system fused ATPase/permease subunit
MTVTVQVSIYVFLLIFTFYVLISRVAFYGYIIGGVMLVFFVILFFYLRYSAIVKKHFSAGTGIVVSHTAETLTGLAVVRAFGKEGQFLAINQTYQDSLYDTAVELINLNHWLAVRVDLCGIVLVCATVFVAILLDDNSVITDSSAGLLVSNSIQILLFLTASCTTFGDINVSSAMSAPQSLHLANPIFVTKTCVDIHTGIHKGACIRTYVALTKQCRLADPNFFRGCG